MCRVLLSMSILYIASGIICIACMGVQESDPINMESSQVAYIILDLWYKFYHDSRRVVMVSGNRPQGDLDLCPVLLGVNYVNWL